jgi:hypothetical protein
MCDRTMRGNDDTRSALPVKHAELERLNVTARFLCVVHVGGGEIPQKNVFITAAVREAISQESASLCLAVCVIHERELHINLLSKGI